MNSLQRYLHTLEGKPVDHLARMPVLMQFVAKFAGAHYGEFCSDYRIRNQANIEVARFFGSDQVDVMSDPYCETEAFGAELIYEPAAVPHCRKHPLEDGPDPVKLVRPDLMQSQRVRDRLDGLRAYRQEVGGEYSIMGWVEGPAAEAADLRGVENFFVDLYENPAYSNDLMSLCVDVALEFAKMQLDSGAETIGVGDAVASQVSPDVYENQILPHEQRLCRGLREMGAKVRLHICGNITHLLPGIASLEIDILDSDHMVDIQKTRAIVGNRVVLCGNLDPVADILRSTPESIRAAVLECYQKAGNPFIVNAGCEIPSHTSYENLKALCEPVSYQ